MMAGLLIALMMQIGKHGCALTKYRVCANVPIECNVHRMYFDLAHLAFSPLEVLMSDTGRFGVTVAGHIAAKQSHRLVCASTPEREPIARQHLFGCIQQFNVVRD